ncbi:hypothetical protein BZG01_11380 [Labilibaculum manganireducens]|uniref:Secretion system C-terminal sorting domain-containing protein n=1 Tax=Labilibaculum manganireducens TaxID=1940525 RepID=A0A2N3I7X7_9BACT|nr:Ig-like domain-containing protein [Labilibaculum manganireducens]PKQ66399.1 hypothetical protein BZG01_11380 [Labilibaculum manganireducens]
MKRVIFIFLLLFTSPYVYAQRTMIDSTYSENVDRYGKYIIRSKTKYSRSDDNLTDTLIRYVNYSDYFYQNGVSIIEYYPDGLKKNVTYWASGSSFDFEKANEDYQYFYTSDGKLEKRNTLFVHNEVRQPLFVSDYYYTDNVLDSITRKRFNTTTGIYYKDMIQSYIYLENGNYEIIESNNIPELNEFRKGFKTLYMLDSEGRTSETKYYKYKYESEEWVDRNFYYLYEYSDVENTRTQIENETPRDKSVESFDEHGNMTRSRLYFWDKNQSYWYLDHDNTTSYFYHYITPDAIAPTLTLTSTQGNTTDSAFTINVTFSEAVTGFELADLTITNGTISNFESVSETEYSALITPTSRGIVTVDVSAGVATDLSGNDNETALQFVITYEIPTGIENLKEKGITIYPIPTKDNLYLISNRFYGNVQVEIYNKHGKCVYTQQFTSPCTKNIDFSNFNSGTYILRMKTGKEVINSKILVIR